MSAPQAAILSAAHRPSEPEDPIEALRRRPPIGRTRRAVVDLADGLARWRLWGRLGWQDIMIRYRRSVLGPFWLTLSMGVMVGTLGTLYSTIFKIDTQTYLPFLTLGFLIWGFVSQTILEGCQCFIEGENFIRQLDMPLSIFVYRMVWRNLITLGHNAVIYVIVAIIEVVSLDWSLALVIPGLILMVLNASWIGFLFGMLSARFRDIPQIVGSLVQVVFFMTPIIWTPNQVADRPFLVNANPIFHLVEVVRAPLLGRQPAALSWIVVGGMVALGWLASFALFRRFRGRVAYWV